MTEPMSTPLYRAEMKREAAIREAKRKYWDAHTAALAELERAEQAARDEYDRETSEYIGALCDAWLDWRRAA